jgi:hypothetical protein
VVQACLDRTSSLVSACRTVHPVLINLRGKVHIIPEIPRLSVASQHTKEYNTHAPDPPQISPDLCSWQIIRWQKEGVHPILCKCVASKALIRKPNGKLLIRRHFESSPYMLRIRSLMTTYRNRHLLLRSVKRRFWTRKRGIISRRECFHSSRVMVLHHTRRCGVNRHTQRTVGIPSCFRITGRCGIPFHCPL